MKLTIVDYYDSEPGVGKCFAFSVFFSEHVFVIIYMQGSKDHAAMVLPT